MIKKILIALSLSLGISLSYFPTAIAEPFSVAPVVNPNSVAQFPLNEQFLTKLEAVQEGLHSLPPEANNPKYGNDTSIGGIIANIQDKPNFMALLRKNGLDAHDYVVGGMAVAAALAAAASEGEDQIFDETLAVSQENFEFGKKYADRIRRLLDQ